MTLKELYMRVAELSKIFLVAFPADGTIDAVYVSEHESAK